MLFPLKRRCGQKRAATTELSELLALLVGTPPVAYRRLQLRPIRARQSWNPPQRLCQQLRCDTDHQRRYHWILAWPCVGLSYRPLFGLRRLFFSSSCGPRSEPSPLAPSPPMARLELCPKSFETWP